jgi:hypothetical protein
MPPNADEAPAGGAKAARPARPTSPVPLPRSLRSNADGEGRGGDRVSRSSGAVQPSSSSPRAVAGKPAEAEAQPSVGPANSRERPASTHQPLTTRSGKTLRPPCGEARLPSPALAVSGHAREQGGAASAGVEPRERPVRKARSIGVRVTTETPAAPALPERVTRSRPRSARNAKDGGKDGGKDGATSRGSLSRRGRDSSGPEPAEEDVNKPSTTRGGTVLHLSQTERSGPATSVPPAPDVPDPSSLPTEGSGTLAPRASHDAVEADGKLETAPEPTPAYPAAGTRRAPQRLVKPVHLDSTGADAGGGGGGEAGSNGESWSLPNVLNGPAEEAAPEEQVSTVFTEPAPAGAGRRPMQFYVGMTRLDRHDLARSIVVNGGRLTGVPGGNLDPRPTYPLMDALSGVNPDGRFAYSDAYVARCIEAGKALDIEDFRLGRRARPVPRAVLVARHVAAAAAGAAGTERRGGGRAAGGKGGAPRRPRVDFTAEEDERLIAFAGGFMRTTGCGLTSRRMWEQACAENILGRPARCESLRNRYKNFLAPGIAKRRRRERSSRAARKAKLTTLRPPPEDTSGVDDESDPDSDEGEAEGVGTDTERDLAARRTFGALRRKNTQRIGRSDASRSPLVAGAEDGRAHARVPAASRRPQRTVTKVRKPKAPSSQLLEIVDTLSKACGVSRRRAFVRLRENGGDAKAALRALSEHCK